jgi:hypothetical protein
LGADSFSHKAFPEDGKIAPVKEKKFAWFWIINCVRRQGSAEQAVTPANAHKR